MERMRSSCSPKRDLRDLEKIRMALFDGGGLAGTDRFVKRYEKDLELFFDVKYATAVSSGTAAIHSVLFALGVKAGDEVIVPVVAAVMSALPVIELGARPVFVDCEENSFAIDIAKLEKVISKKTKAVISVPMWGYPATTTSLINLCKSKKIFLIVDAAQGIGTIADGFLEGTNAEAGCFSTHEIKLISTGEGGFILTNHKNLDSRVRRFTRLGNSQNDKKKTFGQYYGLNYKFNALGAGLGISQLEKLTENLKKRRINAATWLEVLAPYHKLLRPLMLEDAHNKPSFYSIIFLLDFEFADKFSGKQLSDRLAKKGIETDIYKYDFRLLPEYPVFAPFYGANTGSLSQDFPNATQTLNGMIILPTHEEITRTDIITVSKCLIKIILSKHPQLRASRQSHHEPNFA